MDEQFQIRILKSKPKPAPEKTELPGPVSYSIISTSPMEVGTSKGVSIIPEGSLLGKFECRMGIDPTTLQKAIGRDMNIMENGEVKLNRPRKYGDEWFDEGTQTGSITSEWETLEPSWINSTIGRYSKLVFDEAQ